MRFRNTLISLTSIIIGITSLSLPLTQPAIAQGVGYLFVYGGFNQQGRYISGWKYDNDPVLARQGATQACHQYGGINCTEIGTVTGNSCIGIGRDYNERIHTATGNERALIGTFQNMKNLSITCANGRKFTRGIDWERSY